MPSRRVRVAAPGTIAAVAPSPLVLLLVGLLTLTTVVGCSSDAPVELNQTRPRVTVTVTTTVTLPPSTPATSSSTSNPGDAPASTGAPGGGTASGRPTASSTLASTSASGNPSPGATGDARRVRLVDDYQSLTRQIAVIDALPRTGATTESALDDLAGRFRALRAAPVPAGVDRPSYVGRLFSLELFAAAAADEARASSPQAAARYDVIRAQTATLLGLVNSGLGTALALPAAGASPSPTSTGLRATPSTR